MSTTDATLSWIDAASALVLATTVVVATGAYLVRVLVVGVFHSDRAAQEGAGSFLLGSEVMAAGMWTLGPLVRLALRARISADALTVASVPLALLAAVALATGHYGSAALVGALASILDVLDGAVARATATAGLRGKLLDTIVDRYVDALLFGALVVHFRVHVATLLIAVGALVGATLVSYASALAREAGDAAAAAPRGLMRRGERLVWLVGAALVSELVRWTGASAALVSAPIAAVLAAIALLGNASATRRMLAIRAAAGGERLREDGTQAMNATSATGPSQAISVHPKSPDVKKIHAPPGLASH